MKKPILFLTVALTSALCAGFVACDAETCVTSEYKIINRIGSEIVVELTFGDRQRTTIEPNGTQVIHRDIWCYKEPPAGVPAPGVLRAEMKIDGEIVPEIVWLRQLWDIDSDAEKGRTTYTLTVTDEFLETIRNMNDNLTTNKT